MCSVNYNYKTGKYQSGVVVESCEFDDLDCKVRRKPIIPFAGLRVGVACVFIAV